MNQAKIARIEQLIALSASPEIEEARNAGYLAAKLIRELGVKLTLTETPEPHDTPPNDSTSNEFADSTVFRVIVSKYAGKCRTCKLPYGPGDRVQWMPRRGAAHVSCAWGA